MKALMTHRAMKALMVDRVMKALMANRAKKALMAKSKGNLMHSIVLSDASKVSLLDSLRSQVNMVQFGRQNLQENDPSNEDRFVEIAIKYRYSHELRSIQ